MATLLTEAASTAPVMAPAPLKKLRLLLFMLIPIGR